MSTDPTSSCDALRELLGELALGEEGWLSDDERRRAEAHAAECPACRAYMADVAAIGGALRGLGRAEADIEVPERILLETRLHILAAVRAKTLELRQQRLEAAWRRRARLWWSACAAAGALVIGLGLWWGLSVLKATPFARRDPVLSIPTDEVTAVGALGSPQPASKQPIDDGFFASTKNPKQALELLEGELASCTSAPQVARGAFDRIIAMAQALRARWPGSAQAAQALKVISRCHTEMGDEIRAREAFLAYADARGALAQTTALREGCSPTDARGRADALTADLIRGEALRRLMRRDYLPGMSYCDVLLTRYPGTEVALRARYMTGRYYRETRRGAQAIAAYQAVIDQAPDSALAMNARTWLPSLLFNAGRRDAAVAMWLEYSELSSEYNEKACGYCNAGALEAARGEPHHPNAVKLFRTVVQEYPASGYARQAKAMIAKLSKNIDDVILDGLSDM